MKKIKACFAVVSVQTVIIMAASLYIAVTATDEIDRAFAVDILLFTAAFSVFLSFLGILLLYINTRKETK